MLRVGILYADVAGCGFYRCALPASLAHLDDVDALLVEQLAVNVDPRTGSVASVPEIDADVLVFQRPMATLLCETIPFVKAQGIAVVVELDDDLERVPRGNMAYSKIAPQFNADINSNWLRKAVRLSDLMTVSTPALAQRYRADTTVRVVRNRISSHWMDPDKVRKIPFDPEAAPLVGWAGQVAFHPGDLQQMGGAIKSLVTDGLARWEIIGDHWGVPEATGLTTSQFRSTGWVDLEDYPAALAQLDIGVVPLERTQFNRAKSYLKGIEMAAVGVPFVATPTEEYQHLHKKYGLGLLANNPSDWMRHLKRLIASPALRADMAAQGQDTIRARLTIETGISEWTDAWRWALAARRSKSGVLSR